MPAAVSFTSSGIKSGEAEREKENETNVTIDTEKNTNDVSGTPATDENELKTPSPWSTSAEGPTSSNNTRQNDFLSPTTTSIHPEIPAEPKNGGNTMSQEEEATMEQQPTQQQVGKVRPK
jgi:hypothetical protein